MAEISYLQYSKNYSRLQERASSSLERNGDKVPLQKVQRIL